MKKLILCATVLSVLGVTFKLGIAKEPVAGQPEVTNSQSANPAPLTFEDRVAAAYREFTFNGEKLSFEAFSKAYKGYLNLREAGKLNGARQILTIADFSLSSTRKRLWILDMKSRKVLLNDLVAHGQGSGMEFATSFSNTGNSHQSSLGFYVTGGTYTGKHGNSLRLNGMDEGFNSAALERAVVVHGADYVSQDFVSGQKRLGRSWGCPAVSNQIIGKVIDYIAGGTCLFVYAPQEKYLAKSQWLNKLPEMISVDQMAVTPAPKKDTIMQYVTGNL